MPTLNELIKSSVRCHRVFITSALKGNNRVIATLLALDYNTFRDTVVTEERGDTVEEALTNLQAAIDEMDYVNGELQDG